MRGFRRFKRAFALLLFAVAVGAVGAVGAAEDAPRAPEAASRIVSINPSLTAMLLAIGAGDHLVGVDDFSAQSQPEVAHLPRVGGLYDSSVEAVAALEPDLVVLVPSVQQEGFRNQLATLGVPVRGFNPRSFDDVLATLEALGDAVGRPRAAAERVRAIRHARAEVAPPGGAEPVRAVLVLQRDPLYVVGKGSFIDEMLAMVGAENLAASLADGYPRASLEWLLAARPDVLMDASRDTMGAAVYWARWPSLATARIVGLPPGAATLPGPDLDRALRILAGAIRPVSAEPDAARPPDDAGRPQPVRAR